MTSTIRLFLLVLLLFSSSAHAVEFKRAFSPRQDRLTVLDGDTVCYRRRPERRETVCWRILGIDTPEIHKKCSKALALRARDELTKILFSGRPLVWVSRKPDKYGRPLVKIRVGGVDPAKSLVAMGLARAYFGKQKVDWCATD